MPKRDATDGERLCTLIQRRIVAPGKWTLVEDALTPLTRARDLTHFFREIAAIQLTGKLISGGISIRIALAPLDTDAQLEAFDRQLRDLFRTSTALGFHERRDIEPQILNRLRDAVNAATGDISPKTLNDVRHFARHSHNWCYLCQRKLQFFSLDSLPLGVDRESLFEAEHVWPQSYGGNSEIENLLPACHSCNRHKANYPNWAMVDIQSMIHGLDPSQEELRRIPGSRRFSLISRQACQLADRKSMTLKEAFQEIGPGIEPYVLDSQDVADFFNISNVRSA